MTSLLRKNKLTHHQARFEAQYDPRKQPGIYRGDRCGVCAFFLRENLCQKVLPPQTENGWCAVGVRSSGPNKDHHFSPDWRKIESGLQSAINRRKPQNDT